MVYADTMNTLQMHLYCNWHTVEIKKNCNAKNIIQLSMYTTFLTSGISSLLGCNPAATLEIVSTSKSFL